MKKLFLLLVMIYPMLFSMDKSEQAKKDALVINTLCTKHNVPMQQLFAHNILYVTNSLKIKCVFKGELIKVLGAVKIFGKKCSTMLIKNAEHKNGKLIWEIAQFKYLLLKYFDESENFLYEDVQKIKDFFII